MAADFTILSLCAGGGGLERAVRIVLPHARVIALVEREAFCVETLATALETDGVAEAALWPDLATFDGKPWRGLVDMLTAGIPCQPHSVAGKRLGAADERNLWPACERIIREVEPPFVFLENVAGAIAFFGEHVIGGLERMGYRVEAGLFKAAEIGAPHRRRRLFVLAHASRLCGHRSPRTPRRCGGGTERAGEVVADDAEGRRPGRDLPVRRPQQQGQAEGDAVRGRPTVADASSGQHPQRQGERRDDGEERETAPGSGLPLFPPGPGDLDAWRRVLEIDPTLEPAICGVADGLASRADRLRLLGNAVVPLQGAYAFCTLLARLEARLKGR